MGRIAVLLVLIAGFIWFISRYVFAPQYTNPALNQVVLQALRTQDFSALRAPMDKTPLAFHGRTLAVLRRIYPRPDLGHDAFVVEFDVHPSFFPYGTISRSVFVLVRDARHLNDIKRHLRNSDDYSPYLVQPRSWNGSEVQF